MLQRSPSYIAALPSVGLRPWLGRLLPQRAAYHLRRLDSIRGQQIFWEYCRRRPAQATELLRGAVAKQIGWPMVEQHFTPRYRPWDQRLCVAPDGDLFSAIGAGTVTVATDQIDASCLTVSGSRLVGSCAQMSSSAQRDSSFNPPAVSLCKLTIDASTWAK